MVMESGCMPRLGEYRSSAIQTPVNSSSPAPAPIPKVQKKHLTNLKFKNCKNMFDDQNKIEPENLRNKILFCNHNLVRSTLL
jgi:hypothetical protein